MHSSRTALVIGANGGIGRETCLALKKHGWQVRALVRHLPAEQEGITWIQGDAMQLADVLAAASGVDVIVHAVNPPGYRNWDTLVLPMLDNTIEAAKAARARIVLPGTIYNFGPDAFPLLREDSPQHPQTRKGEIRAEMERRLAEATHAGVRTLIHIPDRLIEGYGPNVEAIRSLAADGASLLVTVDCGTTSHEPLAEAARLGQQGW